MRVIADPVRRPWRRILVDLLLRVVAIAFVMGLVLVLLPAMVEAAL
jgi:hypothetical protein